LHATDAVRVEDTDLDTSRGAIADQDALFASRSDGEGRVGLALLQPGDEIRWEKTLEERQRPAERDAPGAIAWGGFAIDELI